MNNKVKKLFGVKVDICDNNLNIDPESQKI